MRHTPVTFHQFHRLYAAIRARLGRADDLLEAAVTESGVYTGTGATIFGEDGEEYHLLTTKRPFQDAGGLLAHVSVQQVQERGGSRIFNARVDLDSMEVVVVANSQFDVDDLIKAIQPPSENAQETRNYLDQMVRHQTPAEYSDERKADGTKSARAILAGIGGLPDLDAYETPYVAQAMVELLKEPAPFGQAARVERATAWARDPNTQPEWGQFVLAALERLG